MKHKGTKMILTSIPIRICFKSTVACLLLLTLVFSGCADKNKQRNISDTAGVDRKKNKSKDSLGFQLPSIPITINSQEEQINYLASHYWDLYDFTDTVRISKPELTEQALVDYLALLEEVGSDISANSVKKLVREMGKEATVYMWFKEKLEHYLYDPNSPIRNDELYVNVLEEELASETLAEIYKERTKYQLTMLKKNRVGTKAANFNFKLPSGKKNSLWNLKSEYILLLLYNPECHNCQKAIEVLDSSPILTKIVESSDEVGSPLLTVLSVSIEGSEEEWDKHLSIMPLSWLNGFDEQELIRTKELYDSRSVPSIYLLDKNKNVLIKDANAPEVLEYLANVL